MFENLQESRFENVSSISDLEIQNFMNKCPQVKLNVATLPDF